MMPYARIFVMPCSYVPPISAEKPHQLRLFKAENIISVLSLPPRWSGATLATVSTQRVVSCIAAVFC